MSVMRGSFLGGPLPFLARVDVVLNGRRALCRIEEAIGFDDEVLVREDEVVVVGLRMRMGWRRGVRRRKRGEMWEGAIVREGW
jgi:hypothetical protein